MKAEDSSLLMLLAVLWTVVRSQCFWQQNFVSCSYIHRETMFSFSLKHFVLCNVIRAELKTQWISIRQDLSLTPFILLYI